MAPKNIVFDWSLEETQNQWEPSTPPDYLYAGDGTQLTSSQEEEQTQDRMKRKREAEQERTKDHNSVAEASAPQNVITIDDSPSSKTQPLNRPSSNTHTFR